MFASPCRCPRRPTPGRAGRGLTSARSGRGHARHHGFDLHAGLCVVAQPVVAGVGAPRRSCGHGDQGETMSKILVPSAGPGDWRCLLAKPEEHWARGKSARTLAHCWEDCGGFPPEITGILGESALGKLEPLLVFPEWKVSLPGRGPASQNDVWVLAKAEDGLVSIAIEGKVDEPFDQILGKWKKNASAGKKDRLKYLISCLGLNSEPPDAICYQLMHRTASAVIEAERFDARAAVMLVHSFSRDDAGFCEYRDFCFLLGIEEVQAGVLGTTRARNDLPLYLGWVRGDERYLRS